ncbi:MAG: PGPGW domain-containing protein [Nocardioidaceae bacterium]
MHRNPITGFITKVVVTILGVAVIGAGLVMMVTPGPGIVGILVGLGLLSTEYHWAERWMHAAKAKAQAAADKARDLDPAVRRRRLVLTVLGVLVIGGAVWAYLATYDWPVFAVEAWDWVQGLHEVVPELPGM